MRLCLIAPSMTVPSRDWHYPRVPPLGVAYLGACARKAGHDVAVVDGLGEALDSFHEFIGSSYVNGLTIDEVVRRIDPRTEIIGVSVTFSKQWPLV